MFLIKFVEYGSIAIMIMAATFALFLFPKLEKVLKLLGAFLFFTVILQFFATYLNLQGENNLFLFHIYSPVEFFIFSYILRSIIKSATARRFISISCILFILFCIYNMSAIETLSRFNSLPRGIEGVLAIGFCIYFFYELFISDESVHLTKYPPFWLFSGWLIYFSGTFFLYIYKNHSGYTYTYPIIHSILNIFLNLVYIYVLWLGSRKSIS